MAGLINILVLVGTASFGARLFLTGLYTRYRAFFILLILSTLQGAIAVLVNPGSGLYQKLYVISEPVQWMVYVLAVLELYRLILEGYQGLYTAGRWAMSVAVILGILISGISLIFPSHGTQQSQLMAFYYMAERAVYFSLVVFLLIILGVLMQYPLDLRRNIVTHSIVFSIFFFSNTVIYLLLSTRGSAAIQTAQIAISILNLLALGAWWVWLDPTGEAQKTQARPHWMPGREEELVSQFNQLNEALLRLARK